MDRRRELAAFIKTKRTNLRPEDAGLSVTARRRTPGLRREEVAQRAAVGLTWYTWLEQGRAITVSAQVLRGVARALQLTPVEEQHLFTLAQLPMPKRIEQPVYEVDDRLQAIIASIVTLPAMLINQKWDVIAWNPLMQKLCGTLEGKSPAERNMLRIMFTDPESRARITNWQQQAQNAIGLFRSTKAGFVEAPWYLELIASLAAESQEFREWLPAYTINQAMHTPKLYQHPDPRVGEIAIWPVFLNPQEYPNVELVVYTPADKVSEQKLALLTEL